MTDEPATRASVERRLSEVESDAVARASGAADGDELESLRVSVLGKKGALTRLLRSLASVDPAERPAVGKAANRVKQAVEAAIARRGAELDEVARSARLGGPQVDVTLPAAGQPRGHAHPLVATNEEICEILRSLGFSVVEGPETEDDYHNFEALNIPPDHPARDMQDTFFVAGGYLLRTHTSPVQIRTMKRSRPPLAIIAPGAVYRQGDDDATHSPMFHQVEGLMVGEGITFGDLKGVLTRFLRRLFGDERGVRFRPSYFPFTEPSAEVDIGCGICAGRGDRDGEVCRVCRGAGWLEVLGAGMVHPAVFRQVGYDPERYTGFAFGVGVERIAMLRLGVDDIRLFFANDLRFLSQY